MTTVEPQEEDYSDEDDDDEGGDLSKYNLGDEVRINIAIKPQAEMKVIKSLKLLFACHTVW